MILYFVLGFFSPKSFNLADKCFLLNFQPKMRYGKNLVFPARGRRLNSHISETAQPILLKFKLSLNLMIPSKPQKYEKGRLKFIVLATYTRNNFFSL